MTTTGHYTVSKVQKALHNVFICSISLGIQQRSVGYEKSVPMIIFQVRSAMKTISDALFLVYRKFVTFSLLVERKY